MNELLAFFLQYTLIMKNKEIKSCKKITNLKKTFLKNKNIKYLQ